jgi:hypothetical protein
MRMIHPEPMSALDAVDARRARITQHRVKAHLASGQLASYCAETKLSRSSFSPQFGKSIRNRQYDFFWNAPASRWNYDGCPCRNGPLSLAGKQMLQQGHLPVFAVAA